MSRRVATLKDEIDLHKKVINDFRKAETKKIFVEFASNFEEDIFDDDFDDAFDDDDDFDFFMPQQNKSQKKR